MTHNNLNTHSEELARHILGNHNSALVADVIACGCIQASINKAVLEAKAGLLNDLIDEYGKKTWGQYDPQIILETTLEQLQKELSNEK